MRVAHLSLADFRNYATAELELAAGPNLLIGRNGQGKTNLVEAIGYFATLRSHRVTGDGPLIRAGAEAAVARMRVASQDREVVLELQLNRERANRAQVNRHGVRPREVTRWFTAVGFFPEDLAIVRGEPSGRRRFLDDALVARHPVAAGALGDYERVLRQRTSLLKSARHGSGALESTLQIWDDQLVEFGTQIMLARRALVSDLAEPLRRSYARLVEQDHRPTLRLAESVSATLDAAVSRETPMESSAREAVSRETLAEDFRAALARVRAREIERGVTLVGPHRDELVLSLNELPVKGYASHGESWSFALSLKIALATILREGSAAGDPVIILDDVFAELDERRRERLMSAVSDFEQVIVTAAVEDDVPGGGVRWRRVGIEAGTVLDAERPGIGAGVGASGVPAEADHDDAQSRDERSSAEPRSGESEAAHGSGLGGADEHGGGSG
ncbi:DNA replication/repair protein RecF [Leucobacter massiliensis]|uniref:DNA replication and repair protein RecF n=1 Tax=Leucobacter massiliensis TaxID=1686285 RepID=A0A2S9QRW6_9MICO|nr:DNA replication/repair protein RecF [Leucobacter massiliensis]PRI12333.1 DNA replication/repair protein RecF [Leucobacter massiliensis]